MITIISPQGWLGKLADWLMMPVMFLTQLTFFESLQRTHFWNNKKLTRQEVKKIDRVLCCQVAGLSQPRRRWIWSWFPLFHLPVLGGWRLYVVVETETKGPWFPGWLASDVAGVSLVPITGPVKLLLGPDDVLFFGLMENGEQVRVICLDTGFLGRKGPYSLLPLR